MLKFNLMILYILSFYNLYSDYLQHYKLSAKYEFRAGRDNPKKYIDLAIEKFKENNGKIIVEVGSMRAAFDHDVDNGNCMWCSDGHSTYLWGRTGAQVFSVDIDPAATKIAKEFSKHFNVSVFTQDAIEFLNSFDGPIDLLYLDAWDAIEGTDYAEKHLEAYFAAKKNLHNKSLILIDDTDILEGGKGRYVVPQAIADGYKVIFEGRQTFLSK